LEAGHAVVELRAATSADEAILREILYVALFVPPGSAPFPRSVLDDPAIARYVEAWGTRDGDRGALATADGQSVGAAWVRRFGATEPGYGFVDETIPELTIAVRDTHRGRGIGTSLLRHLQDALPAISLSCDPTNPAWRLYARMGFRAVSGGRTMLWRRTPGAASTVCAPPC
jgi:ribosomal protein S18 acetylase RimI-like enzyme